MSHGIQGVIEDAKIAFGPTIIVGLYNAYAVRKGESKGGERGRDVFQ